MTTILNFIEGLSDSENNLLCLTAMTAMVVLLGFVWQWAS